MCARKYDSVCVCVYWPVLLCNGRIGPEVLRVSYRRRLEKERAMLSEEKQKPGGMDSASVYGVLCTWQDISRKYIM